MEFEPILVFLVGLACGSFVTLASYRLPLNQDIVVKPSRCPQCEHRLGFKDLWPLLSWIISRAKCRHCKAPIPIRYPLTELATGTVILLLYLKYGLGAQFAILGLAWIALMVMIVVDFEHYIIPDQVHYALLPLGIAWHVVNMTPIDEVLQGFVIGGSVGLSLHYGYRFLRKKEGLGFGDVKFFAVAGLWLGLHATVPFLFFSGLFGIFTGLTYRALGKGPIFPFGPALAASLFLCVVFSDVRNIFLYIENISK